MFAIQFNAVYHISVYLFIATKLRLFCLFFQKNLNSSKESETKMFKSCL